MRFFKLPLIAKKYPVAFSFAVVLHIIVLSLVIFYNTSSEWKPIVKKPSYKTKQTDSKIAKAVTVDFELIKQERQRLVNIKKQKQLALKKEQKQLANLKSEKRKVEKAKKLAQTKRLKAEKARKKAEKRKKLAEQAVKKEERRKKLAEQARKKAEAKKKAVEKATKKAETRKKLAEKARKKAEAKKKLAERAAKDADIERKKILLEKQTLEKSYKESLKKYKEYKIKSSVLREATAEEQKENKLLIDKQLQKLKDNYEGLIEVHVRKNWRNSKAFEKGWRCKVLVRQTTQGVVKAVNITNCDNNKSADFQRSIKAAVNKSSPLPKAAVDDIFDAIVEFYFINE